MDWREQLQDCVGSRFEFSDVAPGHDDLGDFRSPVADVLVVIGPENDQHVCDWASKVSKIVVAWGDIGKFKPRADTVLKLLPPVHCLKITKRKFPIHPSRAAALLKPFLFQINSPV